MSTGKSITIESLFGDTRGIHILDTELSNSDKLRTCFLSEIRDLMRMYGVYNFNGNFLDSGEFEVEKFNLSGQGSRFYDLDFREKSI